MSVFRSLLGRFAEYHDSVPLNTKLDISASVWLSLKLQLDSAVKKKILSPDPT